MNKIKTVGSTTDHSAGSKGEFYLNNKNEKIKTVGSTTDNSAGSKGQFKLNNKED